MAGIRKFADDDASLGVGAIIVARTKKYSDLDASFAANSTTGDLYLKKDAAAVKQAVKLLVLTHFTERPYRPFIGTSDNLFELTDGITAEKVGREIRRVIENHEPRARIRELKVTMDAPEETLRARIEFSILNQEETQTLEITIGRLR